MGASMIFEDLFYEEAIHDKDGFAELLEQPISWFRLSPDKAAELKSGAEFTYLDDAVGGLLNKGFADFVGDFIIAYPTYETAVHIKDHVSSTYFYNYNRNATKLPSYMSADHGDDIIVGVSGFPEFIHLYPHLWDKRQFSRDDLRFSRIMMSYWTNFAKTGNPNGPGLPEWGVFDADESYLDLTLTPTMKERPHSARMSFWREHRAKLGM